MIGPYGTPHAFRIALEARLRSVAQQQGTDLQRLQRRVAFERLLARLFADEDPPWLLKGGYALELRLQDRARSTLDLDLAVPEPDRLAPTLARDRAEPMAVRIHEELQNAVECDLGDGFQFLIRLPKRTNLPGGGIRCTVEAHLAGRAFARFRLDVGLGDAVLDPPEWVEGSDLLAFAEVPAARVALYPLAQQIAEKVHAYTFPWRDRDNTRVKDLVDLVLLAQSEQLEPERIRRALEATFQRRGTHPLPIKLPAPPRDWAEPYAALAKELGLPAPTSAEAHAYLDVHWRKWNPRP